MDHYQRIAAEQRPVTVAWSDGSPPDRYDTYTAAVAALRDRYDDAEIGHDGDLLEGGDRTLVWASEDDSVDDEGARAIASIAFSEVE